MIRDWLEKYAGIKIESFFNIRFGAGVVGKTSNVALAMILGLTILGSVAQNVWMLALCALGIIGYSVLYLQKILSFAEQFPDAAVMEGLELSQFKQAELAAKGMPKPLDLQSIENPKMHDLALLSQRSEHQEAE